MVNFITHLETGVRGDPEGVKRSVGVNVGLTACLGWCACVHKSGYVHVFVPVCVGSGGLPRWR